MPQVSDPPLLLKTNLKQLRLPTMVAEFEKLSREAASANETYQQYRKRQRFTIVCYTGIDGALGDGHCCQRFRMA